MSEQNHYVTTPLIKKTKSFKSIFTHSLTEKKKDQSVLRLLQRIGITTKMITSTAKKKLLHDFEGLLRIHFFL